MKPLMAGMAGAVAIMKPADVKKIEMAQKERKRRSLDRGRTGETSSTVGTAMARR